MTVAAVSQMFFPVAFADGKVKVNYLYHLSNFSGTVPYMGAKIRVDNINRELYAIAADGVKIFNDSGMEIYDFSRQTELSNNNDIAIDEAGKIYLLSANYNVFTRESSYSVETCDYKIKPVQKIQLKGLPPDLSGFSPYRIFYRNGLLYFGSMEAMKIVVTDKEGNYKMHFDLSVQFKENNEDAAISDFFVDRDGSILFTAPIIGRAYRVSPDGTVTGFGKRGSKPGSFGIPAAIVADSRGNYLVCDKLRSVVIVFDNKFNFITEFGYRGPRPNNLIVPLSLAIDDHDRLYVSQLARRGVSVFQISNN